MFRILIIVPLMFLGATGTAALAPGGAGGADPAAGLSALQRSEAAALAASRASQQRINRLDDSTAQLSAEYRATLAQIDSLKKYNTQMKRLVAQQKSEQAILRKQIKQAGTIDRRISPLMFEMLDGLEQFINLDQPFLLSQRRARVASLRAQMDRAEVSPSEKFRTLLEAYEIELEYGRTIEAWQGTLPNTDISVQFLRYGRLSWVYQTLDGAETRLWHPRRRQWLPLDGWSADVRLGLRVAKEQAPPSLLLMPLVGQGE